MKKGDIKVMPFFYDRYINLVSDEQTVLEALANSQGILDTIKDDLIKYQDFQYQEGKWTPKEILQHMIDVERIMSYRALALARGEQQRLLAFEEDKYGANTDVRTRTVDDLIEEFKLVRQTTILQFQYFNEQMLLRPGTCSGIDVTPLVFGFICVGHVQHHINVLEERYFKA